MIKGRREKFMWYINYYRGLTLEAALIMAYMNSLEIPAATLRS